MDLVETQYRICLKWCSMTFIWINKMINISKFFHLINSLAKLRLGSVICNSTENSRLTATVSNIWRTLAATSTPSNYKICTALTKNNPSTKTNNNTDGDWWNSIAQMVYKNHQLKLHNNDDKGKKKSNTCKQHRRQQYLQSNGDENRMKISYSQRLSMAQYERCIKRNVRVV